jgi:hypothetical protein
VWVAGVVTQRVARLTGLARLSAPVTRLRRQAMTCGAPPVRTWEARRVQKLGCGRWPAGSVDAGSVL